MTASPFVGPTVQMQAPPHHRHPRPERRPRRHLVAALVTAFCVGAGLVLVLTVAPRPQTPGNVARAFVQARFDQDWSAVWRLHCRAGALPDEAAFVARMRSIDQDFQAPAATVVIVEDVTEERGARAPSFTVTLAIAITDLEPDGRPSTQTARLPVTGEEGEFRVCLQPGWPPEPIR